MNTNDYIRTIADLSDELGYPYEAFTRVHGVFEKFAVSDNPLDGTKNINAAMLTRAFINNVINLEGDLRNNLSNLNIKSSEDVGRIVYGLVSKSLLQADENDSVKDFSGLFSMENLDDYIKKEKIKKERRNFDKILLSLYFVGFIAFMLGYSNKIPQRYEKYSWTIGLIAWLSYYFYRR